MLPSPDCKKRLEAKNVKCLLHYASLFSTQHVDDELKLVKCPYGFLSSLPFSVVPPMLVTGIDPPRGEYRRTPAGTLELLPEPLNVAARTTARAIHKIATKIHEVEYGHLNAALHEVRNLNAHISLASEELLKAHGFGPQDLDDARFESDHRLDAMRSIFVASRELSSSLTLQEISRAPGAARDGIVNHAFATLFERQRQMSTVKLRNRRMSINLKVGDVTARLTDSCHYLPKLLIDNAIKYGEEGTTIDVEVLRTNEHLIIQVKNKSSKLTLADCGKVLNRGYRGSNATSKQVGQGLGLWVASEIAKANAGTITFDFAPETAGQTGTVTVRMLLFEPMPDSVSD